jgi:hypothetical protein
MDRDKLGQEASEYVRGLKEGGEIVRARMETEADEAYRRGRVAERKRRHQVQWRRLFFIMTAAAFAAHVVWALIGMAIGT